MADSLSLYDFQEECLTATDKERRDGHTRIANVMATGLGKTVTFVEDIRRASDDRSRRSAVLVHRDELVDQTLNKFRQIAPALKVGVVKAERNDFNDVDVCVLSVQTISRENRLTQIDPWHFGEITVDECHHTSADSYMRTLNYFGGFNGRPVTGWTATLDRQDNRRLGDIYEVVAYEKDILWGINNGYLRDVYGKAVTVDELDLATVARSRGDYQDGALGEAMENAGAGPIIAEAWLEHAAHPDGPNGYRQGLGFAPNIRSAEYFNAEFNAAGIHTALVLGSTSRDERKAIYAAINSGELQGIWSCGVLTEGFDLPPLSCAIMARPTLSRGFYVQMAGRILRPDLRPASRMPVGTRPIDKALLLDCVGVSGQHRLAGMTNLTKSPIEVRDDETLAEAAFRAAEEADQAIAKAKRKHAERAARMQGNVAYEDVDLFHRSHSAWLQTHGGVWFIPARSRTWFLWPSDKTLDDGTELWLVGWFEGYSTRTGQWTHEGLELPYAMKWAEQEAGEWDPSVSSRDASWRKKRQPPSDAQLNIAQRYRLDVEGKSKGEVSDMISVHIASRILDRKKR